MNEGMIGGKPWVNACFQIIPPFFVSTAIF